MTNSSTQNSRKEAAMKGYRDEDPPFVISHIPDNLADQASGPDQAAVSVKALGYAQDAQWGSPAEAEARALFETTLTPENETLIRTHHPALAAERYVQIIYEGDKKSWRVIRSTSSSRPIPVRIANADVHVVPAHTSPVLAGGAWFDRTYRPDPLAFRVNPRRCLPAAALSAVCKAFPAAIGIQILISRIAVLIYPDMDKMYTDWDGGVPETVGGLSVVYSLPDLDPSTVTIPSGMSTSTTKNGYTDVAALGLRLKMPDGQECITTATHAFIHSESLIMRFLSHCFQMAKNSLRSSKAPPSPSSHPPQVLTPSTKNNNGLGKKVWAAGSNNFIGTVKVTYDEPRKDLHFPAGYHHDLSLIYGQDLPAICPPPNVEMVAEWGPYEDALDGAPVFAVALNAQYERSNVPGGRVASNAVTEAVVQGTAYHWDATANDTTRFSSASLLWRTVEDSLSAGSWAGSVLCLGDPTAEGGVRARPLLFQNYQSVVKDWPAGEAPQLTTSTGTVKGGFFLPKSIHSAGTSDNRLHGRREVMP